MSTADLRGAREPAEALPIPATSSGGDVEPRDLLESLQVVAAELAGRLPLHRIASVVADAALTALNADVSVVVACDEVGRQPRIVHERGLSAIARQRLRTMLATASSVLRRDGQSEAVSLDAVAEALVGPTAVDIARSPSASRALAAPMPPHGIIFVGRTRGGTFSQADRQFLNALAAASALALERLRFEDDPRQEHSTSHGHHAGLRFPGSHVRVGDMQIDLEDQEVVLGDHHARLTPSELRILMFLAATPGRARSRGEILRHLWHTEHVGDERACDAHISNLRRKIERDPARPRRVVTLRGVGYALHLPRNGG
jgi:Transcriptional regulatory protein, C terminal